MEKIDVKNIFPELGKKHTNIINLLIAMADPQYSIENKKMVWDCYQNRYYNMDDILMFFEDSLFSHDGINYLDAFCNTTDYKNFYELAMTLDMANIDPKAYYLFWILNYGHSSYTQIVKDAISYDPDVIHSMFPDIEKVLCIEDE